MSAGKLLISERRTNALKTVLITGGCGGIGEALCRSFKSAGYNIAFTYLSSPEKARLIRDELGDALGLRTDMKSEEDISNAVDETIRKYGDIDCVVNNAGISLTGLFQDHPYEDYEKIFRTNVFGAMLITKKALPFMIRKKKGCVINISSIWGICGASCEVLYSASKAAVHGFTKALAKEVGPSGIRVNCIAPGVIDTPMNAHLCESDINALKEETPLGKIGSPEDIAELAVFLASDKASFITGQIISPNGGLVI